MHSLSTQVERRGGEVREVREEGRAGKVWSRLCVLIITSILYNNMLRNIKLKMFNVILIKAMLVLVFG